MGIRRALWRCKRICRKWKHFVYFILFIIGIKAFFAYHLTPDYADDIRLQQIHQARIDDHNKLAEAILKGEKSLVEKDISDPERNFRYKNSKLDDEAIELEKKFGDTNFPPVVFNPKCTIELKDSLSAISRAKNNFCKQKIADVACKIQDDTLFKKSIPRSCPREGKVVSQANIPSHFDDSQPRVKICYVLVVHGRSTRQIKRLIKNLYNKRHYYYIHVDRRSEYLYREMLKIAEQYSNIEVAKWRLSTIWGGSSLLQMLLRAMKDVLQIWSDWDFFINLSALDFPIETENALEEFLTTHKDKNFMKSHGRDDEKFIRKQGLNKVFLECEQHMWRLGERKLPEGIVLNGGSDWVALNRKVCNTAVYGQSQLLKMLKHWYEYTLLPAESFFHTLVQNSELCESFVDNNLRVTNWNRARGCKCQYKHIVDWCGCSPNDFFPSDLTRLQTSRPVFFARKFEEIVNQEVVNHLDFKLYGKYPHDTPGIYSYWENCYDSEDGVKSVKDEFITHYLSFARLALASINPPLDDDQHIDICRLHIRNLVKVDVFKHKEEFKGYLVTVDAFWKSASDHDKQNAPSTVQIQTLIKKNSNIRILDYSSQLASRLVWAKIGTNWDVKELLLRDWGGIIGPQSDPRLVMKWSEAKEDFIVTVVLIDPLNVIAEYTDFRTPAKSAGVTETVLNLQKPIRPGKWTVRFFIQRNYQKVTAEMNFVVSPLQFKNGVVGSPELSSDNRGIVNDDDLNFIKRNLYSIRTTLNLRKDIGSERSLEERALYEGEDLEAWIDEVVSTTWIPEETCLASPSTDIWLYAQPRKRCKMNNTPSPFLCRDTSWSSFSPDPKSELGPIKSNGRIR